MLSKTPETGSVQRDLVVSRSSRVFFGEPVYGFYLGKPLHEFLTRTATINGPAGSYEKVQGKHYIPGERGRTGIHVLLKQPIEDTRPASLPTLLPEHVGETRYLQLDIDSGLAGMPTDIRDVVSFLNAAVQLANAVPGAEYRAIVVSRPPSDIVPWFEEQRAELNSGWRRAFEDAPGTPGRQLPEGAFDRGDLDKYILWL